MNVLDAVIKIGSAASVPCIRCFLAMLFILKSATGMLQAQDLPAEVEREYLSRKIPKIAFFYKHIAVDLIKASVRANIPPAAVLAIVGLESKYGENYISKITGNITGAVALERENMMPPVKLPSLRYGYQAFLNKKKVAKHRPSDIRWVQYPPSYLIDYRPIPLRGTELKLDYFEYRPLLKKHAQIQSVVDFGALIISNKSEFDAIKEARQWLDELVAQEGKQVIFESQVAYAFIDKISGRGKNTYPKYNKAWGAKVKRLIESTGFVPFVRDLHHKRYTFEEAWGIIFCCAY